ncbi:MAG: DUF1127 domain-containing protein [Gammaproteobacteria bacterium]|nr:DUF1127 domain-containing protein [Gammaproteobacteria bacterium]
MSTLKAKHFHLIDDLDIAALVFAAVERIEGLAVKVNQKARLWQRRSNERRLLAQMNDHILNDIGLTRADVNTETAKYFWQH